MTAGVEGYAALFGIADLTGDIVRAGAFRASLARRTAPLPLLVEHDQRLVAGAWRGWREDGRGLHLSGAIDDAQPGAARARRLLLRGIDGLSIGFVPLAARKHAEGRVLEEIELIEVSIVTNPMQPLARLTIRQPAIGSRQS